MRNVSTMVSPNAIRVSFLATILVGLGLLQAINLPADEPSDAAAAAARLTSDLTFLASDELAGRGVGSEGIAQAGEYIARRFRELGFQTDAFNGQPLSALRHSRAAWHG